MKHTKSPQFRFIYDRLVNSKQLRERRGSEAGAREACHYFSTMTRTPGILRSLMPRENGEQEEVMPPLPPKTCTIEVADAYDSILVREAQQNGWDVTIIRRTVFEARAIRAADKLFWKEMAVKWAKDIRIAQEKPVVLPDEKTEEGVCELCGDELVDGVCKHS